MEMIKQRAQEVRKYYEGLNDDEIITKIADENERMEAQIDSLEEDNDRKEAEVKCLEKEIEEAEKRSDLQLETIEQISEENKEKCAQIRKLLARIEELENMNARYARRHLRPQYGKAEIPKPELGFVVPWEEPEEIVRIRKDETIQSITIYFKDSEE